MSPTVKIVLENMAKNAVNAALTALGPVALWPAQVHFHNWQGFWHLLLIMGSAVIAREIMVYGPKILAWSQTTNGVH